MTAPSGCKCLHARVKERRSYGFDLWKVELTKVKHYNDVRNTGELYNALQPDKTTFEVEVELDTELVRAERQKVAAQQPNCFNAIVLMAMKYVRGLAKEATRASQASPPAPKQ